MERTPKIEEIFGGTEEQKHEAMQSAKEAALSSGEELFGENLVEPSPKERRAIRNAVDFANEVAAHYGARRQFSADRVFLLKEGGVKASTKGVLAQGVANAHTDSVGIDRRPSSLLTAKAVIHEVLHINGIHSYQVYVDDSADPSASAFGLPYRTGMSMHGGKGEGVYFGDAEEAIVSIIAGRYLEREATSNPEYREDAEATNTIKQWLLSYAESHIDDPVQKASATRFINDIMLLPRSKEVADVFLHSDKPAAYKLGLFDARYEEGIRSGVLLLERSRERESFERVSKRIIAALPEGTMSGEQLFDEFARAHFLGNYMPLARIIERALGPGSFRMIAEELGRMDDTPAPDGNFVE